MLYSWNTPTKSLKKWGTTWSGEENKYFVLAAVLLRAQFSLVWAGGLVHKGYVEVGFAPSHIAEKKLCQTLVALLGAEALAKCHSQVEKCGFFCQGKA